MAYRTEQEQIELFRKWWKDNGVITIVAVVLALGVYIGWTQWQAYQHRRIEAASVIYQDLLKADQEEAGGAGKTEAIARLQGDYADTFYGQAALLFLAEEAVIHGDLGDAEGHLDKLIKQNPGEDLAYIARLRSAKVLHALGKDEDALARLQDPVEKGFKVLFAEMQGDIYLAQNQKDKAHAAYEEALAAAEADKNAQKDILEMKRSQASAP